MRLTRPDIDHIAVTHDPLALKWIPHPWYELCMLAVQKNGLMLQFVPAHLQDDHLCITAVKNDSRAVQYVHDRTRWLLILGSMALERVVS